ncbi:MAG TPA: DEDD exonuclease domain-containing protein, partial [Actinomycetota bacterium]|nr:DEDD exonuclease domain-containing protein [Actinomycetota bacterium]
MARQASFEELGRPLAEVTFCVLDLETTGGSAEDDAITEVGAVKVRRGETVGTFHTLVDPGRPVPAFIRLLTGIDDSMLASAPDIHAVLPTLLPFLEGTVIVAHNARFDVGFLNAAARRAAYPTLTNQVVDTAHLARKILAGEVPNNKLSTLARHLRCAHQPCHRAFADVLATVDVLHHLIERVSGYGVTTLEDLLSISTARIDQTFRKIRICDALPRGCGVYRFLGAGGNVLYVGKATDIRQRVRSYFYGDGRRKIRDLLREAQSVEAERFATMLEAELAEARLIASEKPPYNRVGKRDGAWFLKVRSGAGGKRARISTARVPKEDGSLYMGPFPTMSHVRTLIDGLRDAARIHRCTEPRSCTGCAFGELGTCVGTDVPEHNEEADKVRRALTGDHRAVLDGVHARMQRLARSERFEEAAELRDRGAALERALDRN